MSLRFNIASLLSVSVVSLMLCEGTACWASLITPALPEFVADSVAENDSMAAPAEGSPAEDESPGDSPLNPLRLAAQKGLTPTGSSSSSSSSSAPTFGSGGLTLCGIAADFTQYALSGDQSERLYADSHFFIPDAVHSRLFRPPRVA